MSWYRLAVGICGFVISGVLVLSPARAADNGPGSLPEPLTLGEALTIADQGYPDLQTAEADLAQARAARDAVEAGNGVQASIDGRLRWVEPSPVVPNQTHNDSEAGLFITKRLYDFGRTESKLNAAAADIRSRQLDYISVRAQHKLDVMAAYFDVLLADLKYNRDNENMAVAYVTFDRMRDRLKQGEVSELDVLQYQEDYQRVRRQRYASDVRRRATRARLANLLNHPGVLPSSLAVPALPQLRHKLPEVEQLQKEAVENNPTLRSLRARIQAAQARVQEARAGSYPVIDGEVEAAAYNRELGSSDRYRAGIVFRVPLFSSGAVSAEVARQQAVLWRAQAALAKKRMAVRQAVLEAWQRIYVLHAQRDAARVNSDYRDLYLDRSRAMYQLDLKTDLGDSMVQLTAAQLYTAQTRYQLALTLARINALTGQPVWSQPAAGGVKSDSATK